ncbi:MAG: serine acetyltransferase [Acidobacteriota bacterium]
MSDATIAADAMRHPPTPSLAALVRSDLDRYVEIRDRRGTPYSKMRLLAETVLFKAGWQAALLYRLSHWLGARGWTWPAWALQRTSLTLTGADIEYGAVIGPGLLIVHASGIVIGRGTVLGAGTTIFQGVTFGIRDWTPDGVRRYPRAGDGCFFFARATLLGGVRIGDGAVVGAHALVLTDIPAGALAVGVPAVARAGAGWAAAREWVG